MVNLGSECYWNIEVSMSSFLSNFEHAEWEINEQNEYKCISKFNTANQVTQSILRTWRVALQPLFHFWIKMFERFSLFAMSGIVPSVELRNEYLFFSSDTPIPPHTDSVEMIKNFMWRFRCITCIKMKTRDRLLVMLHVSIYSATKTKGFYPYI